MLLRSVHQESLYCPSLVLQRREEWESEILGQTQEPAGRQSKQEKRDLLQKQSGGQGSPTGRCMEVPDESRRQQVSEQDRDGASSRGKLVWRRSGGVSLAEILKIQHAAQGQFDCAQSRCSSELWNLKAQTQQTTENNGKIRNSNTTREDRINADK